jgi:hypothetical protein
MQISGINQKQLQQGSPVKKQEGQPDKVILGSSDKELPDFIKNGKLLSQTAKDKGNALENFYHEYQTPVHVAGGALLAAGIARFAGLPGEAVMGAVGTGVVAGIFAGDQKRALCMAGGAVLGTAIATIAGAPAAAVVSAAGTGTLIGWFIG